MKVRVRLLYIVHATLAVSEMDDHQMIRLVIESTSDKLFG